MALLLAPYNEAMGGIKTSERDLKQRDHAAEASKHAKTVSTFEGEKSDAAFQEHGIGVHPGTGTVVVQRASADGQNVVSQVVTWEARFVDSMSDITNKLNISGSLAIKVSGMSEGGGVEGKASFLDEKLFTKGRRNYHIHVKVVNQHLYTDDVTEFVPLKHVQPGQFTDVYGDSYISGFLEGGEFDAVVSFDTSTDTSNWNVGGSIKAHFKTTGVEVSGKAQGGKTENSKKVDMSTDIKVSWSGGGDIKENSIAEWDIAGLMKVAMEFPDLVAACPQRINAIITKYTSLRSYHEQTSLGSPLDYENAGIYTSSLLDAYMEYKLHWRTIQRLTADLEANVGSIQKSLVLKGLEEHAKAMKTAYEAQALNFSKSQAQGQGQELAVWREKESAPVKLERPLPPNAAQQYEPDLLGLDKARRECRFEMIKIVREVDAVSRNPQVAVDPDRNWQYLTPGIFKLLLPGKEVEIRTKEKEIEAMKLKLRSALTPSAKGGPVKLLATSAGRPQHEKLRASIDGVSHKVDNFRMTAYAGADQVEASRSHFFNDLEDLAVTDRLLKLMVWTNAGKISGVKISYTNGTERAHGLTEGNPQHTLSVASDGSEDITEVQIDETQNSNNQLCLARIAVATSNCNAMVPEAVVADRTHNFAMTDDRQWSLRGFFGFYAERAIETLGVIWGRDEQTQAIRSMQHPPAKNFLALPAPLQYKTRQALTSPESTRGNISFYIGSMISTGNKAIGSDGQSFAVNTFSALDTIKGSWKLQSLTFYANPAARQQLKGLKATYTNGISVSHGTFAENDERWECNVDSPVIAAKLTVGKHEDSNFAFVHTVELVRGEEDGSMPSWPLDVATIRYFGIMNAQAEAEKNVNTISVLVESAPTLGRANWSLKGFYGEESQGCISRLGLIWGYE